MFLSPARAGHSHTSAAFILLPTFGGEVPRQTGRRGHEPQRTAWPMTHDPSVAV
jgi:hypothetical protein